MNKNERALAKRTKLILSFLKKISDRRPVLKFVDVQECDGKDRMVFTNSYVGFWLNEDIPELPHCKDANVGNYPNMVQIYKTHSFKANNADNVRCDVDLAKLSLAIKTKVEFVSISGVGFDPKMLKLALDVMDTNNVVIEFFKSLDMVCGEIHIGNNLGYALLLGARLKEDSLANAIDVGVAL